VRRLKQLPDDQRRSEIDLLRRRSGLHPRQPQLTRAELVELEGAGVEIGNHTMTHPCLDRCADDVVRQEIVGAHNVLAAAVGRPPRAFAYPNGNWDERAEAQLVELGYRIAFLFDHRLAPIPGTDPLRVSRLRVNSDTSLDRLSTIISGLHPAVHRMRGGR
jgi:peptidoglycan/xylan/chitin deacetylase (PgdA/CDA1 family)